MGERSDLIRMALWIWLVDAGIYGLLLLLFPGFLVEGFAGDEAFNYYWIRWSGGILLGLAAGAWLALRSVGHERPYVIACGIGALLAGVGLVWGAAAGEYDGRTWFLWLTFLSSLPVGALLLYASVPHQVPSRE